MTSLVAVCIFAAAVGVTPQMPQAVRDNQCAICHIRLVRTRSTITHADQWVTSKHAMFGVGCEKCHGGDPATTDQQAAHRTLTNRAERSNACGGCHPSEVNAFARSAHDELLQRGEAAAPACTFCHSSMAADVPSPRDLERRCSRCHSAAGDERATRARQSLDDLAALRKTLRRAKLEVAAVIDERRRRMLGDDWTNADHAISAVVAAIHAFDQPRVDERLDDARVQVSRLRTALERR